ncbi:MAG: ABC transporter substrate-binding protein [Cyanobacteria bacterium P01_F01_bin.153]
MGRRGWQLKGEGRSLWQGLLKGLPKRLSWVALVGVIAWIIVSCTNFADSLPRKSADAAIPRLVGSTLSNPKTFNPVLNNESPNVFGFTYEGLVKLDPKERKLVPSLAEKWEILDDGRRYIFTLQDNLRWSDGEPITSEDVVFSFNDVYFNPKIPSSSADIFRIGAEGKFPTIKALDSQRVEVVLPEAFAPLLNSMSASILPEHVLKKTVTETNSKGEPVFLTTWGLDTKPEELVSNGPYKIESYATSQRVIFEKNPYYWGKDQDGNPLPKIDRFIWQIVESQDTALLQFRSGGLDLLGVTPDYFSLLKREEERGNFTIYEDGPVSSKSFITFNLNKRTKNGKPVVEPYKSVWFNDVRFRKAIAHAIDRPTLINNIYRGLGEAQNSPLSLQSPYYKADGLPTYDYSLDQARALLKEAGFSDRNGVLYDGDGNEVRFTLMTNAGNKIREAMVSQIKQDLSKVGIQVDIQALAFGTLVDKLDTTLDWEACVLGLTGGVEPHGGTNVWNVNGRLHMFNQSPPAGEPLEGWVAADWEKEISDLYVKGSQTVDEVERKAIYGESQRLIQEQLPFIYLIAPLSIGAARDSIVGVDYNALGGVLWKLDSLQLQEQISAE